MGDRASARRATSIAWAVGQRIARSSGVSLVCRGDPDIPMAGPVGTLHSHDSSAKQRHFDESLSGHRIDQVAFCDRLGRLDHAKASERFAGSFQDALGTETQRASVGRGCGQANQVAISRFGHGAHGACMRRRPRRSCPRRNCRRARRSRLRLPPRWPRSTRGVAGRSTGEPGLDTPAIVPHRAGDAEPDRLEPAMPRIRAGMHLAASSDGIFANRRGRADATDRGPPAVRPSDADSLRPNVVIDSRGVPFLRCPRIGRESGQCSISARPDRGKATLCGSQAAVTGFWHQSGKLGWKQGQDHGQRKPPPTRSRRRRMAWNWCGRDRYMGVSGSRLQVQGFGKRRLPWSAVVFGWFEQRLPAVEVFQADQRPARHGGAGAPPRFARAGRSVRRSDDPGPAAEAPPPQSTTP